MVSSTTNVETMNMNGSNDTSQVVGQNFDGHNINHSSHTGLSALLNAVTLHISKSDEEQQHNNEPDRPYSKADDNDSGDCQLKKAPCSTTPVMVPETHESQKNSFPGRLMTLLLDPDNGDIVTFLPDGKYFALRRDAFATKVMKSKLKFDEYRAFVVELSEWGFCPVETKRPGIEVYRHRLFRKGDWKRCEEMKQGDSGTESKELSPLVTTASRTSSISEDDYPMDRSNESVKRRLSPTSAAKTNNSSIAKLRMHSSDEESSASNDTRPREERRMRALSITTDKLNIREMDTTELPLVQQAVTGATHTIVTDAIEALLRDEDHTRRTFEKHADELSKSSLPGLVPISKQLFSVGEKSATNGNSGADDKKKKKQKEEEEKTGSAEKPTRMEGNMLLALAKK
jgi:hypothetical protein